MSAAQTHACMRVFVLRELVARLVLTKVNPQAIFFLDLDLDLVVWMRPTAAAIRYVRVLLVTTATFASCPLQPSQQR
jgi:hypothetical protein